MNVLDLLYLPVSVEGDVIQLLLLKCHFSNICHGFPSLGITSTAYVVGWVGRVQNKGSAAWKNTSFQSVQYHAIRDTFIYITLS